MHRQAVESSNIRTVGYDSERLILEVEFSSGAVYRYSEVSSEVWHGFQNAISKGSFLAQSIKPTFSVQRMFSDLNTEIEADGEAKLDFMTNYLGEQDYDYEVVGGAIWTTPEGKAAVERAWEEQQTVEQTGGS